MPASAKAAPGERELRELISRSRVFDPGLKRAWLRVLPYMAEGQRRELGEILRLEATRRADAGELDG